MFATVEKYAIISRKGILRHNRAFFIISSFLQDVKPIFLFLKIRLKNPEKPACISVFPDSFLLYYTIDYYTRAQLCNNGGRFSVSRITIF